MICACLAIKLWLDWREMGKPRPPLHAFLCPLGFWIMSLGLIGAIMTVIVCSVWTRLACHWWAHNVVLHDWIVWPMMYIVVGAFILASHYSRYFRIIPDDMDSGAEGEQLFLGVED